MSDPKRDPAGDRELHYPVRHDDPTGPWCNHCTPLTALADPAQAVPYPCPTIQADGSTDE